MYSYVKIYSYVKAWMDLYITYIHLSIYVHYTYYVQKTTTMDLIDTNHSQVFLLKAIRFEKLGCSKSKTK